jgi:hypothetical protein
MDSSESQISTSDIMATVKRMESRCLSMKGEVFEELAQAYKELAPRFERELKGSERDIALAKSSALMVLQEYDLPSASRLTATLGLAGEVKFVGLIDNSASALS